MGEYNYVTGSYFEVYLSGAPAGMSGTFSSVSGLNMEFEYETYMEGGSMYPRYFLKNAVPQTLVLEQGTVTSIDQLAIIVNTVNLGMSVPLAGIIMLKDNTGSIVREWTIAGAHITKYIGPSLNSNEASMAITRIELMYGGCT